MESNGSERLYARYFRRKRAGGRGRLALILDGALFRLILFTGAYLFFGTRLPGSEARALLLAGVFLLMCELAFRVVSEIRLEAFMQKELRRIRRLLTVDRLLLLDGPGIRALCAPLVARGETPVLLQRTAPADGDAVIAALRTRRGKGRVGILACGGFTPDAEALASRSGGMISLYPADVLLGGAAEAGLTPSAGEVRAYIAAELPRMEKKRRPRLPAPFAPGRAGKYLLAALALTAASFLTRYALYYRMLAGLCGAVASLGVFLNRTHPERSP